MSNTPSNLNLLITDSFWGWLRREKKNWASFIPPVALSAAFTIVKWASEKFNLFGPGKSDDQGFRPDFIIWLLVGQTAVIGVLLIFNPEPIEDPIQSKRSTIAIRQFHQAWRMLWLFWFIEYTGLSLYELKVIPGKEIPGGASSPQAYIPPEYISVVLNLLNNLPTMALIVCYVISSERTVKEKHGEFSSKALPWDKLIVILIAITTVESLIRYKVIPLPLFHEANSPDIFSWLSGVAAGTATALIVGRLDSKFINLPFVIITPLYFYAVIQAGWEPLLKQPTTRAILLNLAFALKCLLFAVVQWLFKSGVLLFYLEKVGFLIDQVNPERRKFLHRVQRNIGIAADDDAGEGDQAIGTGRHTD